VIPAARLAWAAAVVAASLPAHAQSLGELARREELRRRSAPRAVTTLSNADLAGVRDRGAPSDEAAPADAAAPESCYRSRSLGRCVRPEDLVSLSVAGVVTEENAPFEQEWRRDAQSLRTLIEAARGRLAGLRAAIADEERSPGERKVAGKALDTAREAIITLERQWQKLERNAADQRIPRAWIEPVPVFTSLPPQ